MSRLCVFACGLAICTARVRAADALLATGFDRQARQVSALLAPPSAEKTIPIPWVDRYDYDSVQDRDGTTVFNTDRFTACLIRRRHVEVKAEIDSTATICATNSRDHGWSGGITVSFTRFWRR